MGSVPCMVRRGCALCAPATVAGLEMEGMPALTGRTELTTAALGAKAVEASGWRWSPHAVVGWFVVHGCRMPERKPGCDMRGAVPCWGSVGAALAWASVAAVIRTSTCSGCKPSTGAAASRRVVSILPSSQLATKALGAVNRSPPAWPLRPLKRRQCRSV